MQVALNDTAELSKGGVRRARLMNGIALAAAVGDAISIFSFEPSALPNILSARLRINSHFAASFFSLARYSHSALYSSAWVITSAAFMAILPQDRRIIRISKRL